MRAFVFVTELISESFLPGRHPLALFPLLDRPLVQHQIETLVEHGVTELTILASSGIERLRGLLGDGARWGCSLTIQPLSTETPLAPLGSLPESDELVLLVAAEQLFTKFPELAQPRLVMSLQGGWGFCVAPARLIRGLPETLCPAQLGTLLRRTLPTVAQDSTQVDCLPALLAAQRRELERRLGGEVHIARSARVHPRARLIGPVWIGPQCRIGAGVVLGPNVCLGAGCIVERGTRLQDALIAPGSYIGAELELDQVVVDKSRLINLRQEVGLMVEDGFLLGAVSRKFAL